MLGRGDEEGKISNQLLNFLDPSLKSIAAANMSSSSENPPLSTWGLSVGCLRLFGQTRSRSSHFEIWRAVVQKDRPPPTRSPAATRCSAVTNS